MRPAPEIRVRRAALDAEAALMAQLDRFGITRVADTTRLDTAGIPTASVVKPGTTDRCWVYSGKGLTQPDARVRAILECLGRTAALWPCGGWVAEATGRAMGRWPEGSVWPPAFFTERVRPDHSDGDAIAFVQATRLVATADGIGEGGLVWVPADLVFRGHRPLGAPATPFAYASTSGLAARVDRWSAVEAALLELIEWDAVSQADVLGSHQALAGMLGLARALWLGSRWLDRFTADVSHAETIDCGSLAEPERMLVEGFHRAGLTVTIKRIPTDVEVPVVGAACARRVSPATVLGCAGYGAGWDEQSALRRALLELAQTGATDLQGALGDRRELEQRRLASLSERRWLLTRGPARPWRPTALLQDAGSCEARVARLVRRLGDVGLNRVGVVDFPAWPGVSAVRVLVPGIETWHATGGWSTLGPRLSARVGVR
jgi:ribosomal protein S12 methylthiotransferase accessory factor YcaO